MILQIRPARPVGVKFPVIAYSSPSASSPMLFMNPDFTGSEGSNTKARWSYHRFPLGISLATRI